MARHRQRALRAIDTAMPTPIRRLWAAASPRRSAPGPTGRSRPGRRSSQSGRGRRPPRRRLTTQRMSDRDPRRGRRRGHRGPGRPRHDPVQVAAALGARWQHHGPRLGADGRRRRGVLRPHRCMQDALCVPGLCPVPCVDPSLGYGDLRDAARTNTGALGHLPRAGPRPACACRERCHDPDQRLHHRRR